MDSGEPDNEGGPTALGKVVDLGKYRVIAELARGGMGVVYLALVRGPAGFSKVFVLKVLKPELAEQQSFVSMFLDEARLAARLNHPNVVQTLEVGTTGGRPFLAMEYLEGQSLHRILRRAQRGGASLPAAHHLTILLATLAGLHHAHELRDYDGAGLEVVHRDVSPHNVLVTYDGQVKVVDFGIAKAADSSSETRTGVLKGKVSYMSPEQTRGDPVDRRADLFAVGVMLWEAIAGRRLWLGKSDVAILHERLTVPVPRPSEVKPGVPPALERIVMRAMAPSPADRYPTADAMRADLEAFLHGAGVPPTPMAELGAFVSQTFAEARALTHSLVDAQLRALQTAGEQASDAVDLVKLPRFASRGTPSGPLSRVSATTSLAWREDSQVATIHATREELRASREALGVASPRRKLVWSAALALATLGAAIALASVESHRPPAEIATPAAAAPTARGTPVSLGDAPSAENKAVPMIDDGSRAAPPNADASHRVALDRAAHHASNVHAAMPAPPRVDEHDAAPAASAPPRTDGSRKPKREIETVNPYAEP